jgi:membrane fusion protein, copper/silver efflux system
MATKLNLGMRNAAIGAAVVAAAIGGFLLVQDRRHSWPFSRHHNLPAGAGDVAAPSVQPVQPTSAIARVAVELPATQLKSLGILAEPVRTERLTDPVRAVATVVADESRISHVHTRVAGWVEQLFVNTTGESVRAGQPLAAVFSQELFSSQNEFLSALQQAQSGPRSVMSEAARTRLKVLGMSDAEIAQIESSRQARRLVTVLAPRSGVIMRRGVTVGAAVDPSTEIATIADLSHVWVLAEVSEGAAAQIKAGTSATLDFPVSGRAPFKSSIEFVYPTLTERTRTVRVRLGVANTDGKLRPGLYGTAEFSAPPRAATTVARDAVVYTGETQHVFVRLDNGVIEPRNVKIGGRVGERIEITEGLSPNDQVVTTGVFLIDSESRLRASGGVRHAGHGSAQQDDQRAATATTSAPAQSTPEQHSTHDESK